MKHVFETLQHIVMFHSGCRRGGFLTLPTNPPRKINVRGQRGSSASFSWPNIVWSAKPAGQHNKLAKNPQEPQPLSSKLTVSYSSALRLLRPLYLETP